MFIYLFVYIKYYVRVLVVKNYSTLIWSRVLALLSTLKVEATFCIELRVSLCLTGFTIWNRDVTDSTSESDGIRHFFEIRNPMDT